MIIDRVGFRLKYFMEMMEMVLEIRNGAKIYIYINICAYVHMYVYVPNVYCMCSKRRNYKSTSRFDFLEHV